MITWKALKAALTRAAVAAGVQDVQEIEIEAFCSCLKTHLGIAAERIAKVMGECNMIHASTHRFEDLQEVGSGGLVRELAAGSGLPLEVCLALLDCINQLVEEEMDNLRDNLRMVTIESLGVWQQVGPSRHIFHLHENLAVERK